MAEIWVGLGGLEGGNVNKPGRVLSSGVGLEGLRGGREVVEVAN